MKHEIIFFSHSCPLRDVAIGFLSRGCHSEQAGLEQESSGDGSSFPRSKRQVQCFPLYRPCEQVMKGLPRRESARHQHAESTFRVVLRSLWAAQAEDLTEPSAVASQGNLGKLLCWRLLSTELSA